VIAESGESRQDDLCDAVWQLAQEVDVLSDEDREVLWPLVERVAKLANAPAGVVHLRALRGGRV
jgi:hypothetical protein